MVSVVIKYGTYGQYSMSCPWVLWETLFLFSTLLPPAHSPSAAKDILNPPEQILRVQGAAAGREKTHHASALMLLDITRVLYCTYKMNNYIVVGSNICEISINY